MIITTLDKFLYRFFGYGEPMKAYTYPLRIHHGLRNALICFDEAHSYEAVAFTNFCRLVRTLYEHGRDIVLMTATMPEAKQVKHLEFLDIIDFVRKRQRNCTIRLQPPARRRLTASFAHTQTSAG